MIEKNAGLEREEVFKIVDKLNEDLKGVIRNLVDDFTSHNHCLRCHLPMPVCEETRDGICFQCKNQSKERNKVLVPGMK